MRSMLLHEGVLGYLDAHRRGGSPKGTVSQYKSILLRMCAALPGRHVNGITTVDLAQFLYGPEGITVGKTAATATVYRSAMRSFFAYAQLMGWTKTITVVPNPIIRQRDHRREALPTRLTAAQMLLMLDTVEHPVMRGMLAVAMNTALRVSDIVKIEMQHLNLLTGDLAVHVQKTGAYDVLPVTLDLDAEFRRYLRWYTDTTGVTVHDSGVFVFPGWEGRSVSPLEGFTYTPRPERPAQYSWAQTRLNALFVDCGIVVEKGEAWHVIRRSVARIYFDSLRYEISHDHALRQTASLLGHKNTATTERYLGLDAERAARDASLRGQPFLTAGTNVTPLRFGESHRTG